MQWLNHKHKYIIILKNSYNRMDKIWLYIKRKTLNNNLQSTHMIIPVRQWLINHNVTIWIWCKVMLWWIHFGLISPGNEVCMLISCSFVISNNVCVCRRYMAEILPTRRKTLSNQSINQSINQSFICPLTFNHVKSNLNFDSWPIKNADLLWNFAVSQLTLNNNNSHIIFDSLTFDPPTYNLTSLTFNPMTIDPLL